MKIELEVNDSTGDFIEWAGYNMAKSKEDRIKKWVLSAVNFSISHGEPQIEKHGKRKEMKAAMDDLFTRIMPK